MYAAHQGGESVRTMISAPRVHYARDGKPAAFWGLNGSASVHGKDLVLTMVNPHVSEIRETEIAIRGGAVKSAITTVLTGSDLHAHNSFDQRAAVVPLVKDPGFTGRSFTLEVPAASVTKLVLTLG
jgi:alpha-N-arabinofuranosidase